MMACVQYKLLGEPYGTVYYGVAPGFFPNVKFHAGMLF